MPAHAPNGWPTLIHVDFANFTITEEFDQITQNGTQRFENFLWRVLKKGIAVITLTVTPTGNHPPSGWMPVAANQPGEGRFHPPGQAQCFDYFDPAADAAEKDAIMIIQHVREHAGNPASPFVDHMRDLDRTRVAVHGSSAGAIALMWAAFGPDRRGLFDPTTNPLLDPGLDWTGQYDRATRPDIAILREGAVWWPAQMTSETGVHFTGPWPACLEATTLDVVPPLALEQSSALFYEDDALNDVMPMLLYYREMYNLLPQSCLAQPTGICTAENHIQENRHSAWHGLMWWARHQEKTVLALAETGPGIGGASSANVHELAMHDLELVGLIADELNPPASLLKISSADPVPLDAKIATWLKERFDEIAPNPWTHSWVRVGPGPPPGAPSGSTVFRPNGELDPGCTLLLPISSAPPGTAAELWIAAWPTTLVDNGCGEIIANPDLVIPLQADGTGRLTYAIRWEELPSQVANVFQVIVDDPEAPCGYTISETWIADSELGD